MEEIVTIAGVMYVNDTSATAPAAAVHAIDVLSQKAQVVHIIAGGADKETDLTPFADAIASHKVSVYLLDGTATTILMQLLDDRGVFYEGPYHSMAEVVDAAASRAEAGDAIALVPGCASFGMFRNEFDRGNQFKDAVKHIQESQGDN